MYDEVEFPEEIPLSESIKDLMRQLLVKDPNRRLGHLAGVKEIKCHSWIGWINKSDYLERKLKMPYPVNLDCFNFDANDITASANRILNGLNYNKLLRNQRHSINQSKSKSKEKRDPLKAPLRKHKHKETSEKYKEYRVDSSSLNKEKCHSNINYSREKGSSQEKYKNQSFSIKKKKHNSPATKMNRFECIRNCYMGNTSSLTKFLRFPTETYESHPDLNKERRSYVKL